MRSLGVIVVSAILLIGCSDSSRPTASSSQSTTASASTTLSTDAITLRYRVKSPQSTGTIEVSTDGTPAYYYLDTLKGAVFDTDGRSGTGCALDLSGCHAITPDEAFVFFQLPDSVLHPFNEHAPFRSLANEPVSEQREIAGRQSDCRLGGTRLKICVDHDTGVLTYSTDTVFETTLTEAIAGADVQAFDAIKAAAPH